ncbi:MAG: flagellar basal-body rod protein FlgG [Myxococcota bacterium]|nr:flagellar basal-body rod protein FlgG [Myxococcota bacterium]
MRALFAAASGMTAQQTRIDNIANNLANVNTTGFKKSRAVFQDLFYQEMVGTSDEAADRASGAVAQVGAGVRMASVEKDHTQGGVVQTNNLLHVALDGNGYLAVETESGEQLFTRDGSFTQDSDGNLVTTGGLLVAGNINIPRDVQNVQILRDGTVQVIMADDSTEFTTVGQLEVSDFANRTGLRSLGGNLYAETPESGEPISVDLGEDVDVVQGFLETSNVDVADELIQMIMAQRAYELNSKVIQAADEALQMAASLRR